MAVALTLTIGHVYRFIDRIDDLRDEDFRAAASESVTATRTTGTHHQLSATQFGKKLL
jgi:hypothetical protein